MTIRDGRLTMTEKRNVSGIDCIFIEVALLGNEAVE